MVTKVLKKDWASYTDGDFTLVNNPWNNGKLENGLPRSRTAATQPATK